MTKATIDARDIVRHTTVNVEIHVINLRWVKFRLWIAVRLLYLACWIGGTGIKINESVDVLITEQPEVPELKP